MHGGKPDDTYDTTPTQGTQITASATPHTLGTITELIASTDYDADFLVIEQTEDMSTSATNASALLNLYVDTGAGDKLIVPSMAFGGHAGTLTCCEVLQLPLFVPKGSQVLLALQGAVASETGTFRVRPHSGFGQFRGGERCTTYGANTGASGGTSVASGAAAWGSWTQLTASMTNPARWIIPTVGSAATTQTSRFLYVQLGVGGSGSERVIGWWPTRTDTAERVMGIPSIPVPCDIPAGSRLSARVWASANTTAIDVIAHCFD